MIKRKKIVRRRRYARKNMIRKPKRIVSSRTGVSKAVGRPPRMLVKLPYTTSYGFTYTAPQNAYLFNLNSLYDPDRTGTGHQPLAFDEWKNLGYTKYRVYGCMFDVAVVNTGAGAPLRCAVAPQNSDAGVQGTEADWEQAGAWNTKIVNYDAEPKRWKGYVKIPSLLGYTNEQFRTSTYTEAIVGANPSELACLKILIGGLFGNGSVTGQVQVRLTYFAEMFDPSPLTISVTKAGQ